MWIFILHLKLLNNIINSNITVTDGPYFLTATQYVYCFYESIVNKQTLNHRWTVYRQSLLLLLETLKMKIKLQWKQILIFSAQASFTETIRL